MRVVNRMLAAGIGLIVAVYRGTLGVWIGGQCRYTPTCSQYMIDAIEKSAIFFVSCIVTFFERTRPASNMANPAAIQKTRNPPTRNNNVVMIYGPISSKPGAAVSASCANPRLGAAISAATMNKDLIFMAFVPFPLGGMS